MASYTKEERQARKDFAKGRSIIEVAESLGMELFRSGSEYRWKEHDSMVLSPQTNLWNWFSQHQGGDTIDLVRKIKDISFNQAVDFINDGDFSQWTFQQREAAQAFKNYLEPYEQPFDEARHYLKEVRGLSDETIDFFYDQGVMTQANAKVGNDIEPVILFKTLNFQGEMIGGNLQGIIENAERYEKHGYFKGIMRNSNGRDGLSVDIGTPERLIFTESPIDLMSYYELHHDQLDNVRLVSMDGLKDVVIETNLVRLESELQKRPIRVEDWLSDERKPLDEAIENGYFADGKHADIITLAVDNDPSGRTFIQSLEKKGANIVTDLPAEKPGFDKQDWNDVLKEAQLSSEIVEVRTAAHSIYPDYLVLVQREEGQEQIYLGKSENYNQIGRYNNSDQSLIFISNDPKDFYLFEESKISREEYIEIQGQTGEERYQRFDVLVRELRENHDLVPIDEQIADQEVLEQPQDNSRLAQSQRKLERLREEQNEAVERVFEHFRQTNGQPMNDKRGGAQFFSQRDRSDERVRSKMAEVKEQERRVERLEETEVTADTRLTEEDIKTIDIKQRIASAESGEELSPEDESWLVENWENITFTVEPIKPVTYGVKDLPEEQTNAQEPPAPLEEPVTYQAFTEALEQSKQTLTDKLQSGELRIQLDDASYFYQLVRKTGWSHPMQQLSDKGIVALKPYRDLFESITAESVDAYKAKGTPEQDRLYEVLRTIQKDANFPSISTDFTAEMAISAYVVNGEMASLRPETWAQQTLDPVGTLAGNISDVLEYPFHEFSSDAYRSALYLRKGLYDFLNEQKGDYTITPETYQAIMDKGANITLSDSQQEKNQELAQAVDQEDIGQTEGKEKAPDQKQELEAEESFSDTENLSVSNEDTQKEGINSSLGSLQLDAEGSPTPASEVSDTFERSVTSRPTSSLHPLKFSINREFGSRDNGRYHDISAEELGKLNRRTYNIQQAAQYYLSELANSEIIYVLSEGQIVRAKFDEENFMHLTGIKAIGKGQTPEKTLHDFAEGNGNFDNIQLANYDAAFDKVNVLPDLPVVLDTKSFYFDDLKQVKRFSKFDSLIKADDKDLILLFRSVDDIDIPVSVYQSRSKVERELGQLDRNVILGVYRYRNDQLEQISINDDYIKDDAQELLDIVKDSLSVENLEEMPSEVTPEAFTGVLDAAYNVGRMPLDQVPEESPKSSHFDEPYTSDKMAVKQGISDWVREIIAEGSARKAADEPQEERQTNPSVMVETRLEEPQEAPEALQQAPVSLPTEENNAEGFSYSTATAEALSNQAIKAIKSYAASPKDLKEYLDFMANFTKYSPRNTALIHEQWRGANAVATFKQWQALGKRMGIGPEDVVGGTSVEYTNERTGNTRTVKNEGLSVRTGEKGKIRLFKPLTEEMIPVFDETGKHVKNDKGNPKYKPKKQATAAEKAAIKKGHLEVKSFPKRDLKTGQALYGTFTVFELSQTNLKPEKYPEIMPNRHYTFDTDKVKTKEVLRGLMDYADHIGISIEKVDMASNAKGLFNVTNQSIQLNDKNTKGEMVGTFIHELAHASLHNPKFKDYKEDIPKDIKELEAEMTSYVTAKHFGLDTSEKAIPYMAQWTDKLSKLSDDELDQSMKRVHQVTKKMLTAVEKHTKPLAQRFTPEQGLAQGQNLNPSPKI